jgi:hypothetical protein
MLCNTQFNTANYFFIIIINIKGWAIWPVPSAELTAALASVSSVSQLFSFLVDCSGMILKGFGVVAFFADVRASSTPIASHYVSLFYFVF